MKCLGEIERRSVKLERGALIASTEVSASGEWGPSLNKPSHALATRTNSGQNSFTLAAHDTRCSPARRVTRAAECPKSIAVLF